MGATPLNTNALGSWVELVIVSSYVSMKMFVERSQRDIVAHDRETKRDTLGV